MEGIIRPPSQTRRRSSVINSTGPAHDGKQSNVPSTPSALKNVLQIPEAEDEGEQAVAGAVSGGSSDWEMGHMDSEDEVGDDEETGLTKADKRLQAKQKKRKMLLKNRIVPENSQKSAEDELASKTFAKAALVNAILIALWYTFSISISVVSRTDRVAVMTIDKS